MARPDELVRMIWPDPVQHFARAWARTGGDSVRIGRCTKQCVTSTPITRWSSRLQRSCAGLAHLKALCSSRGVAHTKLTASNRQEAAAPASTATATVTGATANIAMFRQAIHLPPWKHCTPSPGRQQLGRQRRSPKSMLALHPCASQQFLAVLCLHRLLPLTL